MTIGLAPHASYALGESSAIFLDLRADRYLAVPAPAGTPLRAALDGSGPLDVEASGLSQLLRLGLLSSDAEQFVPLAPTTVALPLRSALELGLPRPRFSTLTCLHVGACCARIAMWKRSRPLDVILASLRRKRERARSFAPSQSSQAIQDAAREFVTHRRFVPGKPVCLADSLALLLFLAERRLAADLVFGVQPSPFMAHCWVQAGTMLLNEGIGQAAALYPVATL